MTIRDIIYLLTAAGLAIALVFKFGYLRRRWSTPQLWAVVVPIFIASVTAWSASPHTIRLLNQTTGISNFTAPLVYCLVTAFSGSTLVLVIFWRYPRAQAWPKVIAVVATYGGAIGAIAILFSVSHVPVERLTDFETYYADQPTVAALLMIYIVASGVGQGMLSYSCLSWARSYDLADRPWLRRGLRLYGIAALLGALSFLVKFLAVVSNWFGQHWLDTVNTLVPVIYALPAMLSALAGIVLPIWGPRLPLLRRWAQRWAAFWTLRPMHRALRRVDPAVVLVAHGKRFDPHHRVRRLLIELGDYEWLLRRQIDPEVGETARRLGQNGSMPDEDLQAAVEAAQLKAALTRHLADVTPGSTRSEHSDTAGVNDSVDIDSELARWLRIARAFIGSPVVAATIRQFPQPHGSLTAPDPKH